MRLLSIEVSPRTNVGWTTGKLDLNHSIVVLQAPNGTGKTPLLKCLVYGLGLHINLPSEISDHCSTVCIDLLSKGKKLRIERVIGNDFQIGLLDLETNERQTFSSESEYSIWFAGQIDLPSVDLTTKGTPPSRTQLYSAVVIPMLWVDQDRGWSKTYFSEKDFIRDQEEELTRLFLTLPIRHPFSRREDFEKAKSEHSAIESRIDIVNRAINQEKRELGEIADSSVDIIDKEISQLQTRLENLGNDLTSTKRISASFDDRIAELKRELSKINSDKAEAEETAHRFQAVGSELNGEIELLGTNVSAAKAFRSFCGGEKCKLFASSEASYGKRLLYLADQMKDIQREVNGLSSKIRTLSLHWNDIVGQISKVEKTRDEALQGSESLAPMTLYRDVVARLSELQSKRSKLDKLSNLRAELVRLLNSRDLQKTVVENLKPGRQSTETAPIRAVFAEKMSNWLTILGTRSLPQPITIDESLKVRFGGKSITEFSGSTLIRVLLAYRTTLYEVSKSQGGVHPGILIMDAPRQHEIDLEDFRKYFEALHQNLSKDSDGLQVVISVSDEVFPQEIPHKKIEPSKQHDGQLKYFGC